MESAATFYFQQFSVRHVQSMKVGTDSVLLGAWAQVANVNRALDVGTGSGLLALMLAQRSAQARIDAVESNAAAAEEARYNFENSPWADRLAVIECDFLAWRTTTRYDLIISNPPYFEKSLLPPDAPRSHARHTVALHAWQILAFAETHLTDGGRVYLVLPTREATALVASARALTITLTRRCAVRSRAHKPVERLLLEFSRAPYPCEETELVLHTTDHGRSAAYQALTRAFYTKG